MANTAAAIRAFDAVTGLRDSTARVRYVRIATRELPAAQQYWPENPIGGGAAATPIGNRHLASFIMGLGSPSPSSAPQAIVALENARLDPGHSRDDGASFTDPDGSHTLRGYLELLLNRLADMKPAALDGVAKGMEEGGWALRVDAEFRSASVSWKRLGDPPEPPERGWDGMAVEAWRKTFADVPLSSDPAWFVRFNEGAGRCLLSFRNDASEQQFPSPARPRGVTRGETTIGFDVIVTAARLWRDTQSRSANAEHASTTRRD